MPVDVDKMKKRRDQLKGDLYSLPEGETILYVCPPSVDRDMACVEARYHYGYMPDKRGSALCLDKKNPLWDEPDFKKALEESGRPEEQECPICAAFVDKGADQFKFTTRWVWNVIPIKFRQSSRLPWQDMEPKVEIFPTGYTIFDGITDQFASEGDITDPDKAVYVRIIRKGTGMNTDYKVYIDNDSLKKPVKMGKAIKAVIRKAQEEEANIFNHVVNFYRGKADLENAMSGVETEDEADSSSDSKVTAPAEGQPPCFGTDCDPGDDECKDCSHFVACAKECGIDITGGKKGGKKDSKKDKPTPESKKKDAEPEVPPSDDEDEEIKALEEKLANARKKASEAKD